MKVTLDLGAYMPERAHETDAGYDLRSRDKVIVRAGSGTVFDTGVHIALPKDTAGLLMSKSGLNVKNGITSTGLIDEGYTGSVKVKLYNHSNYDYQVKPGDKITQLVIIRIAKEGLELVESLEDTERGDSGFGSTGR